MRELNDYFLGEVTKLLRLPSTRVRAWVKQLSDRVILVLATAVDNSVFKLANSLAVASWLLRIHFDRFDI